jgi:hypothetical protein
LEFIWLFQLVVTSLLSERSRATTSLVTHQINRLQLFPWYTMVLFQLVLAPNNKSPLLKWNMFRWHLAYPEQKQNKLKFAPTLQLVLLQVTYQWYRASQAWYQRQPGSSGAPYQFCDGNGCQLMAGTHARPAANQPKLKSWACLTFFLFLCSSQCHMVFLISDHIFFWWWKSSKQHHPSKVISCLSNFI